MRPLRDNGLTIALIVLFLASFGGMIWTGWIAFNNELVQHGKLAISLLTYLCSGDFISAVFENWESEFLQMSAYVILTALLFQRGSAESRDPDEPDRRNDVAPARLSRGHPVWAWLYSYSLGIALAILFVLSFVLHWISSHAAAHNQALRHGGKTESLFEHLADPQLWFESFQNWQSEFLATAVLVVFSIFLRHRNSPESKPTGAPHSETGA
ncbi:hypothetical protein M8994_16385 [Brucella sp. 21LCYQ03]|nr:hypothetical protein [Brucella sp. 21LCYQ03]